jgi:multicomponent Na+:H+ antiporter subunit D
MLACAVQLALVAIQGEVPVLRIGGWPQSFGIVFVLDRLSGLMILIAAVIQTATWWFVCAGALQREEERRFFHPLFLILCGAVNWAFLTADLFNLFVAFEILLISSYALLCLSTGNFSSREMIRFVALNSLGGTLFLAGAGLVYGRYGSLNFADLALRVRLEDPSWGAVALGTLFLFVFGLKAAVFPLFFWLPDAYPRVSPAILPYFAGMLTKVGVYCLYRVFTLIFRVESDAWFSPIILGIAGATMIVGVLGALSRWTVRNILSFHIISQIGYMIFGLGLLSPLGLASGIFYIVHHILVKSTLFFIGGHILFKTGIDDLRGLGGLARSQPLLSALFLATAFSLAGVPPLSGFYGKFGLVIDGLDQGHGTVVTLSILTSLLTLASMLKIWTYVFWGTPSDGSAIKERRNWTLAPILIMTALTLAVALVSGPLMSVADDTARQLLDGSDYIRATLGEAALAPLAELEYGKGN